MIAQAIFAAGCFWGVQATFDKVEGVISTQVGYVGGTTEKPTYQDVLKDNTGHAEAIEITYNTNEVSYSQLLDVFFSSHNPTTKNRQGPDIGTQYRSAIFYLNEEQKKLAINKIHELEISHNFNHPIVTEVVPAKTFYKAEDYHQKYLEKKGLSTCGIKTIEPQNPVITKSNQEWQKELSPEQFYVMRQSGTEPPFSGQYNKFFEDGTYRCSACGNPLFNSDSKFKSSCGWPSFDEAIPNSIKFKSDSSNGMHRTEVICARCGSHLGHIFDDGPTKTGQRFCINSVSLNFKK